jgi:carboxyl-terminal processing protease
MTPRARRALFSLVLFFSVCAVVGSLLQGRVGAQSSAADESQLRDNLKEFTNVYALVEQNYAEPITGDKADTVIYDGAIPGMLRVLDPHSSFHDPKDYAKMQEEQRGRYYGVGMLIQQQQNKIYVALRMKEPPPSAPASSPATSSTPSTARARRHDLRAGSQAAQRPQRHPRHPDHDSRRSEQAALVRPAARRDSQPLGGSEVRDPSRHRLHPPLKGFQQTTAKEVEDAIDSFSDLKGLVFDCAATPADC